MRIAYVCTDPGIPVFGTKGACVHVQEVIRQMRARGHEVTLYTARTGDHRPADLADLTVHRLAVDARDPASREHAQLEASHQVARMVRARGTDMVYERYSLFSAALTEITQALGVPGVLEVNSPLIEEQRRHRHLVDESLAWVLLRLQVTSATSTVCVSEPVTQWVRDALGRAVPALPAEATARVRTVPNGVSVERIRPRPEDPGRVVVTFVGTLKPWHGVADLLEAASLSRGGWQLRVLGDGPEMACLQRRAARLGTRVDLRGAIAPELMPSHLAGSAIGVAPYPNLGGQEQQYFSPLKVLEYMAAGLAVVASDVGQVPQLVGDAAVLVPPSDPPALAEALDALAADPARRSDLGRRARRHAVERHSWRSVVDTILTPVEASHER
ncbi:glycosyltransferase family 4 protein [Actinomyces sp. W5033]|uniref:glycosyltransferase family 4 protein n=1 Tax=Actinomyces sp. W5033 TaxID=3446479 RepID=UPI003EDE998C